jgi:SAM-dependent MidA family methyltransferase
MTALSALIRVEIAGRGPISFERFMELALYHPEHGYYRREREKPRTGREGDFFTSVSVGPLFGRLLARQFFEMWEKLEKPDPFWIIEQGAEDGQLACDILGWCRDETPALFEAIRYAVIEDASTVRARQMEKLKAGAFDKTMRWFPDVFALREHEPVGVFFSNELVDSLPVRLVRRSKGAWLELRVTAGKEENFAWIDFEDDELSEVTRILELPEVEGYSTEINLRARDWMKDVGNALKRGYVLTIDYGFPASVYYAPFRAGGTLTAYLDHRRTEEVLVDPGSRDITAHVDFTALAKMGEETGLATIGFLDQQHFFMGVAHGELSESAGPRTGIAEKVRAWQTLTRPDYLGARFQVLLQAKDAPHDLAGLRFARQGGLD